MGDTSDSSDGEEDVSICSRSMEISKSPSQEDLVPLLECPVCFDLPLPPIRTCLTGHILCSDCCPRLSGCPLCLQPIGHGRNFFAEDFINKSTVFCKYREDGCTDPMTGAQMRSHTPNCNFRPLKCHHCASPKRIPYSDFEHHLLAEHRISAWDINDGGERLIESEKLRSPKALSRKTRPQIYQSSSGFVTKVLFTVAAVSFLLDLAITLFYAVDE